jgi:hypothetical protein
MEFISIKLNKNSFELILSDFRNAKLNFNISYIPALIEFQDAKTTGFRHNIINVLLVDTPKETAFSTLFSMKFPKGNTLIHVCSTINKTIQLLQLDWTNQELEDVIKNLAFQF